MHLTEHGLTGSGRNVKLTWYWLWGTNCMRVEKYFLYVPNFMLFWWSHWVHFLEGAEICIFLLWFCKTLAPGTWIKMGVVQISFLLGAGILWVSWVFEWVSCPGVMNWNDGAEFCAFLLLKKLKICGKIGKCMYWIQYVMDNFVVSHQHTGCLNKCVIGF